MRRADGYHRPRRFGLYLGFETRRRGVACCSGKSLELGAGQRPTARHGAEKAAPLTAFGTLSIKEITVFRVPCSREARARL